MPEKPLRLTTTSLNASAWVDRLAVAHDACFEQAALLALETAREYLQDHFGHLGERDVGDEAEPARGSRPIQRRLVRRELGGRNPSIVPSPPSTTATSARAAPISAVGERPDKRSPPTSFAVCASKTTSKPWFAINVASGGQRPFDAGACWCAPTSATILNWLPISMPALHHR